MTPLTGAALAQALFKPKAVALVGISDDVSKTAARPLRFLRAAGYEGKLYNVNPTRSEVQGEPAFRALSDLPEKVDHAFILTNTGPAMAAVEECGKLGIPVATILAGGFSEKGAEGAEREQQLKALGKQYGVRLLGPSSIGLVNVREKLILTANAAFAEPGLPAGGIFCASHSGSLIGALTSRGRARNIGFHSLVSVGGEADLSVGELCEAALDDPDVTGYLLFLETMRNADALRRFALAAAARDKPVVAYKLGRSEAAAELAVSHTGALAGEDDVADAFLKDCGIVRLETFEGLIEALPLLQHMPRKTFPEKSRGRKPTVGVVTTTGGGAAMAVDQLGVRNVNVVAPTKETLQKLADAGIDASGGRIIDLTLAGTKYEVMKGTLDILMNAPEFDLILATVGSSARYQPDLAVKPVADSINGPLSVSKKPLACFVVPEAPEALNRLTAAGVPNFRTPEACGDVIAAALARRQPNTEIAPAASARGEARTLTEADAYDVFSKVGIPHAPFVVLDVYGEIPQLPFAYPVVAKVLHADIAHKTDVGGVVLPIRDADELRAAVARIRNDVEMKLPGTKVEKILVQAMARSVGEVLVGFKRDVDVGPIVMLAAGGVLTEIYRDRSLRLAPITLDTAYEMIAEVKALQALAGYRGRAKGDLDAVAQTLVAVSKLALLEDMQVQDAEINPVMVLPAGQGALAVDALMIIREK
jgi:acyl-CoA synthetase (NDP forming)